MTTGPSSDRNNLRFGIAAAVIVVAAIGLRLVRLDDDPWLDELWSLSLAERMTTPASVFTLHHDNNNYLNTLWLWTCGADAPAWRLRLHSLLAGIAAVPLTMLVAWKWAAEPRRPAAALLAGCLAAGWHLWVIYSNEARGYAMACAVALMTTSLLPAVVAVQSQRSTLVAFTLLGTLGFVTHLSYLIVFAAQMTWTAATWLANDPELKTNRKAVALRLIDRLVSLAMLPIGTVAFLWTLDLRFAAVGGSSTRDRLGVVLEAIAGVAGFNEPPSLALASSAATVAALTAGLVYFRRSRSPIAAYPLTIMALSPLILFGLAPSGFVWPRHFMTVSTAALPLLAVTLTAGFSAGGWKRGLAVGYLALFAAGNGLEVQRYYRDGRGHYREAVAWMAAHKPEGGIRVSGDHTFRQTMLLDYFSRRQGEFERFEYLPPDESAAAAPDFFYAHSLDRNWSPPAELTVGPHRFQLMQSYRSIGIVGWPSAIYAPVR